MKRIILTLTLALFTLPIAKAQDTTPPEFVDIQFNPSQVTPLESFDVIVTATDDISGLKQIELHIKNPEGAQTFYVNYFIDSWTSLGDDKYSYSTSIENEFALAGEWYVSLFSISDNAENRNTQQFNASNSPGTFNLCDPCDDEISSNDVIILNGDVVVSKANGFIMKSEQNGKCYRFKIIDAAVELEEVNCN